MHVEPREWGSKKSHLISIDDNNYNMNQGPFFIFLWNGLLITMTLCVGCIKTPSPHVDTQKTNTPASYTGATEKARPFEDGWVDDFQDDNLENLILEALESNYDLQATSSRVAAAQASFQSINAGWKPLLNLNQSDSRSKTVFNPFAGPLQSRYINRFDLGVTLAWEIDLWGRIRSQGRAALADLQASELDYMAARLSLAANVAAAWFNVIESELQVRLNEETLNSFESNLKVVEESYQRGIPNRALDVRLTRANVESTRSNLLVRKRQRDAAVRSMEILLGRYPSAELEIIPHLPILKGHVPTGMPSDLLIRRPDIFSAERRVAAATQRLKVSRKSLLPSIRLTSSVGTSSSELTDLLDPERLALSIAGSLTQPLYQGGRLRANVQLSDARLQESIAQFSQTVLRAFQEVESLLAAEAFLRDQEMALQATSEESSEAEVLAKEQYERGLVDIITVLESERRAFNARSSLINVANLRLQNRLSLYLALGGHFQGEAPDNPTDQVTLNE